MDDGEWHMLTLTTLPPRVLPTPSPSPPGGSSSSGGSGGSGGSSGSSATTASAGHALYLDGVVRAVLRPGVRRSTTNKSDAAVQVCGWPVGGAGVCVRTCACPCGAAPVEGRRGRTGARVGVVHARALARVTLHRQQGFWR